MRTKSLSLAVASATVALLVSGCGGGGGGGGTAAGGGGGGGAATSVSGTAATGLPFDNASITVIDKTGAVVGTGTSGADGSYTISLAAGAVAPFVLQAVRDDETLVSVAPAAGTINITPISHLVAARLASSGDPTKLAAEAAQLTPAAITAKVSEVVAVVQPLLDAAGVTADPLTGTFAANGQGLDRALDSLSVTITPASATESNIEVSVKQQMSEDQAPVLRQFSSNSASLAALPAVAPANLVKPGTAPLIADLLAKMNACFALPAAQRVAVANTNGQTAAGITAPACRQVFYNDDPSTFLSNGRVVGSNVGTNAFPNIFRSGADGLVFDRGTYEFTRTNGDIVIGYRSTDSSGNVTQDSFVVRPDNVAAPTKLQQIGNQYVYDGGVKPYHQLRSFVNDPTSDYYSTGYAFSVANTLDGLGNPLFARVVVTSPSNRTFTLKPNGSMATLQLVKGPLPSDITGVSFLRLRSVYVSPTRAADSPSDADTKMFFALTPPSDAEIVGFAQKGVWKFEYYLASAPTTLAATQYYRTRARALSIGELKHQSLAELTPATVSDLVAQSAGTGALPAPAAGYPLAWTVGTTALPPTSLTVWGNRSGVLFNDTLGVGSTARSGTVPCVKKTAPDVHCTGTVIGQASSYNTGSVLNGLHLFSRDPAGREYAHFYATYSIGTTAD